MTMLVTWAITTMKRTERDLMPLKFEKWITREMLRANPAASHIFGDNLQRKGFGGQAAAMRGEPNALGLPTKRLPDMSPRAFLTDADLGMIVMLTEHDIDALFRKLESGGDVIWPEAGIGMGLAQLPIRAPKIMAYYDAVLQGLLACQRQGRDQ